MLRFPQELEIIGDPMGRAEGLGGEICHTAGDMRAERAEMGAMGIWREESGAEYGGGICALSRAERERGYIETK